MGPMNTCRTCKFWEIEETLTRTYILSGAGECCCQKIRDTDGDVLADELVHESYGMGRRFWTGPDFGCVHHQNKPD